MCSEVMNSTLVYLSKAFIVSDSYRANCLVWFMVFNATFNNISAISWRSVLLLEEIASTRKITHLLEVADKLSHIVLYQVTPCHEWSFEQL